LPYELGDIVLVDTGEKGGYIDTHAIVEIVAIEKRKGSEGEYNHYICNPIKIYHGKSFKYFEDDSNVYYHSKKITRQELTALLL